MPCPCETCYIIVEIVDHLIKAYLVYGVFLSNILNIYCRFAGKIVGRYYDSEGNPTKYLKGVEMKAKRGAQLLEKQKREEDKVPNCNSKWSQAEGGEVSNPFN